MSPELAAITADPSKLEERLHRWNVETIQQIDSSRSQALATKYREALEELLAELEDRQDVEGDSESLRPNWEMQMAERIRRVLP